jgi:hypothetical protein
VDAERYSVSVSPERHPIRLLVAGGTDAVMVAQLTYVTHTVRNLPISVQYIYTMWERYLTPSLSHDPKSTLVQFSEYTIILGRAFIQRAKS